MAHILEAGTNLSNFCKKKHELILVKNNLLWAHFSVLSAISEILMESLGAHSIRSLHIQHFCLLDEGFQAEGVTVKFAQVLAVLYQSASF